MNMKETFENMTEENKKEIIDFLFEEENEKIFKEHFDNQDALKPSYGYHPVCWETDSHDLEINIWEHCPTFAPINHAFGIAVKWVVKYNFAECLQAFDKEAVREAINKAIPCANIIIATPKALEEVLVEEIKIKIIKELI